jgi:hypothetical protein
VVFGLRILIDNMTAIPLREVPSQFLDPQAWAQVRELTSSEMEALCSLNAPYPDGAQDHPIIRTVWPVVRRARFMIELEEIDTAAAQLGVHQANVERDYVFGWLLKAFSKTNTLRPT